MKTIRTILILAVLALASTASFAQGFFGKAQQSVEWTYAFENQETGSALFTVTADIPDGYHIYGINNPDNPSSIRFEELTGCELDGEIFEMSESVLHKGIRSFFGELKLGQKLKITGSPVKIKATIEWQPCDETSCGMPQEWAFEASYVPASLPAIALIPAEPAKDTAAAVPAVTEKKKESASSTWALVLEAILWGFAMLLTPCVFPMVPMTVSFFMKGSSTKAAGRFKASMYGLFIVLLYTVPISLIILITNLIGGDAVTSDIFSWLSTHWLPNLIFFIVFMVFAASFFGAFEIKLPQSIVNKSDKGADKGGLMGIFFMALTLVLVSFSCTGPIVGTVLIKSTEGEFWTPMVTMLAFSIAFALPFTLLAFFPSLLKNMKKSGGGWLNSVKVVLGFIELALGLKFLSMADQTYHWGLLDREVYLALWIVIFTLLGFYLLGKLRFAHDEPVEKINVKRLFLAIIDFAFVIYMIPGMWGAPLKALSGYLPPITTQDFILGAEQPVIMEKLPAAAEISSFGKKYDLHLPHNLIGCFTLEEGIRAAQEQDKPIFLDITGHGCVNCREMESRVWSDPRVLERLRNDFIITALYVDDKTKMEKEDWLTAESGDVFKHIGRANAYIARTRFEVSSQPAYILLDKNGKQLTAPYSYNLNVQDFIDFLDSIKK